MNLTPQDTGRLVSWPAPPHDTITVRITSISSDGITWQSADGTRDHSPITAHVTAGYITRNWRPATPSEADAFRQRRTRHL
ncbi:hypothetical protein [Streptomyces sp. DHE17-7]|uniref:hypothetical protein n=1 Tax=Streptomyces sp. DHE17-7 TaxID=2759949 RepID=UPI000ECD15F7|nr:hypothetical protein [Streptomyces sp. DHE17-7]MBJ6623541.1 hypothetical protein [Streptomyces sp. DHE17-7]RIH58273.1 hypothetical protein D3C59_36165 [Streptomyces sp. SHP22-7]RIH58404.1 hypothetical protein D3C59_35270 [Streptomyces sp. SHP22-7]RIH58635.1 hypothetical protein D3C59_33875 [Streptomyces sp. SHP22-7]